MKNAQNVWDQLYCFENIFQDRFVSPILNIFKMDLISFLKLGYKTLKNVCESCEDN